ncbi:MAG: glycosyltransferase [Pseudomonadota bacterium]
METPGSPPRKPTICFVSSMCLLDPVSGAAHSVRTILETLAQNGFSSFAYTASLFDSNDEVSLAQFLGKNASAPDAPGKLLRTTRNGVEHIVFLTKSSRGTSLNAEEQRSMRTKWQAQLERLRPDIVLSYGTSPLSRAMQTAARKAGAKVVFYLGNQEIKETDFVRPGDTGVSPSKHLAAHYKERLGIETAVINPVIDPGRLVPEGAGLAAQAETRKLGFVTFINPLPHKGLTLLARLIQRARSERPDMRFLVLEGRMPRRILQNMKIDIAALPNVWFLPEQQDMAAVYARTSVLLVPSFWAEGFGRSVVEAQLSGIPVLASTRGGLPEALGEGPQPLQVPQHCIDNHYAFPDAETVDRWWSALVRLWDDDDSYAQASALARSAARPYAPNETRARAVAHFRLVAGLTADASR